MQKRINKQIRKSDALKFSGYDCKKPQQKLVSYKKYEWCMPNKLHENPTWDDIKITVIQKFGSQNVK